MHQLLLALFPTDFIRLEWIITPFDFAASVYCIYMIITGRLNQRIVLLAFILYGVIASMVTITSIVNRDTLENGTYLLVGLIFSLIKGVALLDAMIRAPLFGIKFILIGFLCVNVANLAMYVLGLGYSGSMRFFGLFNHSNGAATFQSFAFCVSLSYLLFCRVGIIACLSLLLSSYFLISSGSRGGFVTLCILAPVMFSIFALRRSDTLRFGILATGLPLAILALLYPSLILDSASSLILQLDSSGAERINSLIEASKVGELSADFDEARGALNEIALDYFIQNPSLFGIGYEMSAEVTGLGIRPHNIFFSSILEFGIVGFLFFFFSISLAGIAVVRAVVAARGGELLLGLFLVFILTALKTPFYFLNGISWTLVLLGYLSWMERGAPNRVPRFVGSLRRSDQAAHHKGLP